MSRDEALQLVKEYTKNENLVKHMLAVECAMRAYARKYGEDEERWAITGLLHDFDYEKMGNEHPSEWGYQLLRSKGIGEDVIQAIVGHVDGGLPLSRPTLMAKALFAVDELTGFIVACALPRPRQISDLEVKSVKKKLKDKAFAKGVKREDIEIGISELGVTLDEHIETVINAMRGIKNELGLK
ncbi:HDIG domain-containing protein [Candidatus Nomurabacteria bacterium]|nr:HDIG domain-containing protein [Candidatus Nomurabacteria bacterium]MCB9803694.1 HDIG domain-containing protein [Candidatus Nomurabacteria bacterium]